MDLIAIRPYLNPYDRSYFKQNRSSYLSDEWSPGKPNHKLFCGTIQQFEHYVQPHGGQPSRKGRNANLDVGLHEYALPIERMVSYTLFDVHYYLCNW